jgi:DnaJ-class molecular chaperone
MAERERAEAARAERTSREVVGETDCAHCNARGFRSFMETTDGKTRDVFEWCSTCEHTGRVVLCRSTAGYHAVEARHVEVFLAGVDRLEAPAVVYLGRERPSGHRYPQPGKRVKSDESAD